jgi:hypothetical protein
LSSLIEYFQAKSQQKPYFLFDGLDRVDEAEKFNQMISADLQNAEIGFAIVGAANRFPERRFDLHPVLKEVLVGLKGAKR